MTKPRKPRENFLDTDIPPSNRQQTEEEPQQVDADDQELDTVFSQFPQNEACIELFRTTEKGGKPAFLEDMTPSDFSFGYVCRNYGGGKYKAKGKYKDGSTVNRNFDIEGAPFPIKRKIPVGIDPQPLPTAQPAPTPAIEMTRNADGSYDMAALVGGMMNMMKSMMLELRSSETEMLAKMKMYKDLFGSEKAQAPPLEQALTMFQRGVEMAGMAGGDGGNSSIWMMALRELKEPLTDIVATIKHAVTSRQPGITPGPTPTTLPPRPPTGAPTAQPEGETMDTIFMGALRQMLPMLVTGAAQEAEEGFYCDFLLDQIPRQYYATAKTWLEKPDCIPQLERFNAGVKAYRAWFDRLQLELLKALNERLADDATRTLQPEPNSDATADRSTDL